MHGNRLRAARALHALTVEQLAAKMIAIGHERGFSAKTLNNLERDIKQMTLMQRRALADALEVPESFFTAPTDQLGPGSYSGSADRARILAHDAT